MPQPSQQFKYLFAIIITNTVVIIGVLVANFAVGQKIYQQTQSTISYSLIGLFSFLPSLATAPFFGQFIDRTNPKYLLIVAGFIAMASVFILWVLHIMKHLVLWNILPLVGLGVLANGLSVQCLWVLVPTMASRQQLVRANGLQQIGEAIAQIVTPSLAVYMLVWLDLDGVFGLSLIGLTLSILLMVFFIQRTPSQTASNQRDESLSNTEIDQKGLKQAWQYLLQTPGMLPLVMIMVAVNFVSLFANVLLTPLVLSFTNIKNLGHVLSIAAFGMLAGGALSSLWTGFAEHRRVQMVLWSTLLLGLTLIAMLIILFLPTQYRVVLIAINCFLFMTGLVVIRANYHAIWQLITPVDIQGSVFGIRKAMIQSTFPLAFLAAGFFGDYVPVAGESWGWNQTASITWLFVVAGLVLVCLMPAFLRCRSLMMLCQSPSFQVSDAGAGGLNPPSPRPR